MIIGLSGWARSGKDTFANALVKTGEWKKIAFADKLRESLLALDPYVFDNYGESFMRVSTLVNIEGWEGAKSGDFSEDMRRLLQRIGTEAGRDIHGEDVWVNATLKDYAGDNLVITDVRFKNEARRIESLGGLVVRIKRTGVGPANDHISEHDLDNWRFGAVVWNDNTVAALESEALRLVKAWQNNLSLLGF